MNPDHFLCAVVAAVFCDERRERLLCGKKDKN
jgi:hypothetical protein